jgi:hypothetical protein
VNSEEISGLEKSFSIKLTRNSAGMGYELKINGLQPDSDEDKGYIADAIQMTKEAMEQAHVTIPIFGKDK